MSRTFAKITIDELRAKIDEAAVKHPDFADRGIDSSTKNIAYTGYLIRSLTPTVEKDLSKVQFDLENWETDKSYVYDMKKGGYTDQLTNDDMNSIMGFNTLDNGLTFLGCSGGGDWEFPVFWIVYWDGKRLRGYIPTDGNPWNTSTNEAFGNDEKADVKNAKKRWPDLYEDWSEVEYLDGDLDFEPEKIISDIKERIVLAGTEAKDKKQNKNNKDLSLPEAYQELEDACEHYLKTCKGMQNGTAKVDLSKGAWPIMEASESAYKRLVDALASVEKVRSEIRKLVGKK